MKKIGTIFTKQEPVTIRVPENYTYVSGIYSENNAPMFLSFLDNVRISPPTIDFPLGEGPSHPVADLHSSRLLKSILAARIPAEQSAVVWDDEGLSP